MPRGVRLCSPTLPRRRRSDPLSLALVGFCGAGCPCEQAAWLADFRGCSFFGVFSALLVALGVVINAALQTSAWLVSCRRDRARLHRDDASWQAGPASASFFDANRPLTSFRSCRHLLRPPPSAARRVRFHPSKRIPFSAIVDFRLGPLPWEVRDPSELVGGRGNQDDRCCRPEWSMPTRAVLLRCSPDHQCRHDAVVDEPEESRTPRCPGTP